MNAGQDRLRSFIQRVERLKEEIDALNKDVSEVYKEARAEGWIVEAMKKVVADRQRMAKNPEKYNEINAVVEMYAAALDGGTIDATRVHARGAKPAAQEPRGAITSLRLQDIALDGTPIANADGSLNFPSVAVDVRVDTSSAGTDGDADRHTDINPAPAVMESIASPRDAYGVEGDGVSSSPSSPENSDQKAVETQVDGKPLAGRGADESPAQIPEPAGTPGGDGRRRTDDKESVDVDAGSAGESPMLDRHEINATARPISEASATRASNGAYLSEADFLGPIPSGFDRRHHA